MSSVSRTRTKSKTKSKMEVVKQDYVTKVFVHGLFCGTYRNDSYAGIYQGGYPPERCVIVVMKQCVEKNGNVEKFQYNDKRIPYDPSPKKGCGCRPCKEYFEMHGGKDVLSVEEQAENSEQAESDSDSDSDYIITEEELEENPELKKMMDERFKKRWEDDGYH